VLKSIKKHFRNKAVNKSISYMLKQRVAYRRRYFGLVMHPCFFCKWSFVINSEFRNNVCKNSELWQCINPMCIMCVADPKEQHVDSRKHRCSRFESDLDKWGMGDSEDVLKRVNKSSLFTRAFYS